MMNPARVDVSAVICVVFDQIAVALDLTFYRRGSFAKLFGNRTDRMPMVEAILDLGAVFQSEVRTLFRRRFN